MANGYNVNQNNPSAWDDLDEAAVEKDAAAKYRPWVAPRPPAPRPGSRTSAADPPDEAVETAAAQFAAVAAGAAPVSGTGLSGPPSSYAPAPYPGLTAKLRPAPRPGRIAPDGNPFEGATKTVKLNRKEILRLIALDIASSEDPFAAGGQWLTEATQTITKAIKDADTADEE